VRLIGQRRPFCTALGLAALLLTACGETTSEEPHASATQWPTDLVFTGSLSAHLQQQPTKGDPSLGGKDCVAGSSADGAPQEFWGVINATAQGPGGRDPISLTIHVQPWGGPGVYHSDGSGKDGLTGISIYDATIDTDWEAAGGLTVNPDLKSGTVNANAATPFRGKGSSVEVTGQWSCA
jgi:hypothetical protein